ncbi:MAG: hypothetical protein ACQEQG_02655 [Bacillota bacterium]
MSTENTTLGQLKVKFTEEAKEFIEEKNFEEVMIKMVRQSGG